jgi:hypothetical protein
MKTQFKLTFAILIIVQFTFGQNVNVYSKKIKTNKNTTILIELYGETVQFVNSPDDNLYIDYDIEFKNFSNKKIREVIDEIKIEANAINNHITIKNIVKSNRMRILSRYNSMFIRIDSTQNVISKTKNNILDEIAEIKSYESFYLEYIKTKYKNDTERREKLLRKYNRFSNRKNNKRSFVIKLPKHLKVDISTKGTQIKFRNDFENEISLRLNDGRLYANKLSNTKNKFKVDNSIVLINALHGGELTLDNVKKSLIGNIDHVKLNSDFSKIEIGQIGKNVTITDFNSQYILYNWAKNFDALELFSEYSKIHFFKPKTDYSFKAVGYNAKHFHNNIEVQLQTKTKKEKFKIIEHLPNNKTNTLGHINFDITNSIIYTYKD